MTIAAPEATEVPRTLDEGPAPRLLSFWDQTALWGNLGISILLLPVAALLLVDGMSLGAGLTAVLVGTLVGNLLLGLAAVPGAQTGAPAMVLMRGLFGARGSWLPTALNFAQLVGWTTFEIWIIAETGGAVVGDGWRPLFVLAAGAAAIVMALRPLGTVRGYLKKVAVWAVLASTAYLLVQILRQDIPPLGRGSWTGFWPATDLVISLSVSWIPLAADYSRHARSARSAFASAALGYGLASGVYFVLGVLAFAVYRDQDVIHSLLAVPAAGLALFILAADEVDEAFANLYSAVVSVQNVNPRLDRRVLALGLGVVCTALAFVFDGNDYESFLLLIGSVFVPLFGVFAADYFLLRRGAWDVSDSARPRWIMVLPWVAGFVVYQLLNPGGVGWWADFWGQGVYAPRLHWSIGASIVSFVVAFALAIPLGALTRRRAAPGTAPAPR
jgi:NCS1 family nucleobase:cation symporter-1